MLFSTFPSLLSAQNQRRKAQRPSLLPRLVFHRFMASDGGLVHEGTRKEQNPLKCLEAQPPGLIFAFRNQSKERRWRPPETGRRQRRLIGRPSELLLTTKYCCVCVGGGSVATREMHTLND